MSSTHGRAWAITIARGISTTPRRLYRLGTAGFCPATSQRSASCRALAATRQTRLRHLLSINRSQLSKRIARACSPACSTFARRLILQSVAKNCGGTPHTLSQDAMPRGSILHLSISARSSASRINRNAISARWKNFAAQKIRKYSR